MRRRFSWLAIVLLSATWLAAQTSPVTGTLVIPDSRVLPGVPFDMWVELRNPSDTAVTVGLYPTMIVRVPGSADFEIVPTVSDAPVLLPRPRTFGGRMQSVTIPARGSQTVTLPIAHDLRPGPFFCDARMLLPGEYRLTLKLDAFPIGHRDELPLTFLGPVITNEAVVERVTTTEVDAKVWQRMQAAGKGRWTVPQFTVTSSPSICQYDLATVHERFAVWTDVLTDYRESAYFPYAVAAHHGTDERYVRLALDALDRFPDSPVADFLHADMRQMLSVYSDGPRHGAYERSVKALTNSKRPTTRIRVFGREDLPPEPCAPEYDCQ